MRIALRRSQGETTAVLLYTDYLPHYSDPLKDYVIAPTTTYLVC